MKESHIEIQIHNSFTEKNNVSKYYNIFMRVWNNCKFIKQWKIVTQQLRHTGLFYTTFNSQNVVITSSNWHLYTKKCKTEIENKIKISRQERNDIF